MAVYTFSAERQLFFYVNVGGQQRLVKFGERNAYGASVFQTILRETAEAIRRHSLFKRGVIREAVNDTAAEDTAARVTTEVLGSGRSTDEAPKGPEAETIEAKNFTQAKSAVAKKLGIGYNDIKTPDQLMQLAKEHGLNIVYKK
jgi:hypothetical protein